MEKHRLCQNERRMLGGPRWLREQPLSWFLLRCFSGFSHRKRRREECCFYPGQVDTTNITAILQKTYFAIPAGLIGRALMSPAVLLLFLCFNNVSLNVSSLFTVIRTNRLLLLWLLLLRCCRLGSEVEGSHFGR